MRVSSGGHLIYTYNTVASAPRSLRYVGIRCQFSDNLLSFLIPGCNCNCPANPPVWLISNYARAGKSNWHSQAQRAPKGIIFSRREILVYENYENAVNSWFSPPWRSVYGPTQTETRARNCIWAFCDVDPPWVLSASLSVQPSASIIRSDCPILPG